MDYSITIHPTAASILGVETSVAPDVVLATLEEHRRVLSENGAGILKNSSESAVTVVSVPGHGRVCVKELRWRGWLHALKGLFRPTQGLRSFRNAGLLRDADVAAVPALALVRRRWFGLVRTEWVVMQVIPGALELDRYLISVLQSGHGAEDLAALARSFGRFIGRMHARGIFHADLKTCNIMASEDHLAEGEAGDAGCGEPSSSPAPRSVQFSLVDYDEVSFSSHLRPGRRIKNLVQIFLSTPVGVRASNRVRFLREYALHAGLDRRERRALAKSVLEAARGRHILYVGFTGDVQERWDSG